MIPAYNTDLVATFGIQVPPTRTYRLDFDQKRVHGMVDGIDAMRQAIHLILMTQRYQWEVFSWNYGFERDALIGSQIPLAYAKAKDFISEALIQDDRVLAVYNFTFEREKNKVTVHFTVDTSEGAVQTETEVVL